MKWATQNKDLLGLTQAKPTFAWGAWNGYVAERLMRLVSAGLMVVIVVQLGEEYKNDEATGVKMPKTWAALDQNASLVLWMVRELDPSAEEPGVPRALVLKDRAQWSVDAFMDEEVQWVFDPPSEQLPERVVWTVLALAGAFISLPHTLRTVLGTVDLKPAVAWAYSLAAFVGVELALIAVALASELKRSEDSTQSPLRQHSLAGVLNSLAMGVGFKPLIDTRHLPERRPSSGVPLVILLFAASLSFNLADTLEDVGLLAPYAAEIHLAARFMAGALGPGLLLIAGHRFAHEVVRAASGRRSREHAYRQALIAWQDGLQASWAAEGEQWQQAALAAAWRSRNPGLGDEHNPHLANTGEAMLPFLPSANGRRQPVG